MLIKDTILRQHFRSHNHPWVDLVSILFHEFVLNFDFVGKSNQWLLSELKIEFEAREMKSNVLHKFKMEHLAFGVKRNIRFVGKVVLNCEIKSAIFFFPFHFSLHFFSHLSSVTNPWAIRFWVSICFMFYVMYAVILRIRCGIRFRNFKLLVPPILFVSTIEALNPTQHTTSTVQSLNSKSIFRVC